MDTRDFRKLDGNGFRVFISTKNSSGKTEVTIVKGENARNKNEGEIVYQKTFSSYKISRSDLIDAYEACGFEYKPE